MPATLVLMQTAARIVAVNKHHTLIKFFRNNIFSEIKFFQKSYFFKEKILSKRKNAPICTASLLPLSVHFYMHCSLYLYLRYNFSLTHIPLSSSSVKVQYQSLDSFAYNDSFLPPYPVNMAINKITSMLTE